MFVCCALRQTLEEVQAFDGKTGLPYKAVEMRSWPKMERISGSIRRTFTRAVIESFYATDTSEGIWVMFRRYASPSGSCHQHSSRLRNLEMLVFPVCFAGTRGHKTCCC